MATRRQIWRPAATIDVAGNIRVVTLAGRLGEAGARDAVLRAAFSSGEATGAVVVDLSAVDYVSSPGAALLADTAREQARAGRPCVWFGVAESVRISLDLAGVLAGLTVATTREQAIGLAVAALDHARSTASATTM
jgi:anti-anti-sigma factor